MWPLVLLAVGHLVVEVARNEAERGDGKHVEITRRRAEAARALVRQRLQQRRRRLVEAVQDAARASDDPRWHAALAGLLAVGRR
jgi:hypothetical protein